MNRPDDDDRKTGNDDTTSFEDDARSMDAGEVEAGGENEIRAQARQAIIDALASERRPDLDLRQTIHVLRAHGFLAELTDSELTKISETICATEQDDTQPQPFRVLYEYWSAHLDRHETDKVVCISEYQGALMLGRLIERFNGLIGLDLFDPEDLVTIDEEGEDDVELPIFVVTNRTDVDEMAIAVHNFPDLVNLYNDKLQEHKDVRRLVRFGRDGNRTAAMVLPITTALNLYGLGLAYLFENLPEDIEPRMPEIVMFVSESAFS